MQLFLQKIEQELIEDPLNVQINETKKKLDGIDMKVFCYYRDEIDDYQQYLHWIREFTKILQKDPIQVKHRLGSSFPDNILFTLPTFFTFLNRCTIKLNELDLYSQRAISHAHKFTDKRNYLSFVDLCGGPGGFVEYILLMHRWSCKGVGITLKGKIDYKLKSFHSNAPSASFVSFTQLPAFRHLQGNILDQETRDLFVDWVKTKLGKVDLVIGDGAFEVDGQEEKQEENIIPILHAETWVAFQLLEDNGSFLLKMFNISFCSTLTLLYGLKCAFISVSFLKPPESRKSNSERYVLCQGFRAPFGQIRWDDFRQRMCSRSHLIYEGEKAKEGEDEFKGMIPYLKRHLSITWKIQFESLSELIAKCDQMPSLGEAKRGEDIDACFTHLAHYFKEWHLSWVHGLTLQVPCSKFELKNAVTHSASSFSSSCIQLFDNWNQLHQDSTFLSILKNHVNTWITKETKKSVRIIHVTNGGQLADINGNTIIAYNSFLQTLQRLPTNTILLVHEDSSIQDVMVIPKYPKLFLRERKDRITLLNQYLNHAFWWMELPPLSPLSTLSTSSS